MRSATTTATGGSPVKRCGRRAAHLSDIGEIICKTSDGPEHGNLTAFIIDMQAPGVTVRPLRQMTGGAAFNEVFFDDVRRAGLRPTGDGRRGLAGGHHHAGQ